MEITSEMIGEGLTCSRRMIATLEKIDFDELANDASFQRQSDEAMIMVLKMFAILEQATLTAGQRSALAVLIHRYNLWAAHMTLDVLDHWSEQARTPGMLN